METIRMAAAQTLYRERSAGFQEQRPHALRTTHFVSGKRRGINVPRVKVHRVLPQRLDGVGMKERTSIMRSTSKVGHGLDASHFAVGSLNRRHRCMAIVSKRRTQRIGRDEPLTVGRDEHDVEAFRF